MFFELEKDEIEVSINGCKFTAYATCEVEASVIKGWKGDWHNRPEPDEVEILGCNGVLVVEATNHDEIKIKIDHWELFHCLWSPDDEEVRQQAFDGDSNE